MKKLLLMALLLAALPVNADAQYIPKTKEEKKMLEMYKALGCDDFETQEDFDMNYTKKFRADRENLCYTIMYAVNDSAKQTVIIDKNSDE